MARKLRVQYPGAIYHVMNRGDRREAVFVDDEDRELFLATLSEACQKTDWQMHAWISYPLYRQEPKGRPSWLRVDRLLGEWGIPTDSPAGRQEFAGRVEARRRAEGASDYEPTG